MKVKCSICLEKDSKIVQRPHWKTGLMTPFVEGTCGSKECVKEYEMVMEMGYKAADEIAEKEKKDSYYREE